MALNRLGEIYYFIGDVEKAIRYRTEAFKIYDNRGQKIYSNSIKAWLNTNEKIKLEKDKQLTERKKICDYYDKKLINLPIIKSKISKEIVSGYHLYIIRIDETKTKKKRFELVNYLLKKKLVLDSITYRFFYIIIIKIFNLKLMIFQIQKDFLILL